MFQERTQGEHIELHNKESMLGNGRTCLGTSCGRRMHQGVERNIVLPFQLWNIGSSARQW